MYAVPTFFPQSSNREDLCRTVSIFDDDTGQPLNLTGITVLSTPNGFTGTNWVISDGAIVTTSSTSITVPGFPVTNQLLALSLTTNDLNLGIMGGDPIAIYDAGGGASMVGYVQSYTPTNGALVVQVGYNFQLEIRRIDQHQHNFGWDYSMWFDWGSGSSLGDVPLIKANLGTGLSIIDIGYLQINIPAMIMQQLHNRTYMIGLAMTDSINTRQVFLGRLPILYGGLTPLVLTGSSTAAVPSVAFS